MQDFQIVILGSDINAYSIARCAHEAYGQRVLMLGKDRLGVTNYSSIINFQKINHFGDKKVFVETLNELAFSPSLLEKGLGDKAKILLVATSDSWVKLVVENKDILDKKFIFNYPKKEITDNMLSKESFYTNYKNIFAEIFPDNLVSLPKTFIYNCNSKNIFELENFISKELQKNFPIILKPSNGVKYYKNSFEKQAKVYKLNSFEEVKSIVSEIEKSGYDDTLIIQEFISGGDEGLCDVVMYANSDNTVEFSTFAQIALQERTPTGVGNCTLLINGFNEYVSTETTEKIVLKLKEFLEKIGYAGFAEFDLKYDPKNKNFKIFEINPRQARSSYYLSPLGKNLVKVLVDDLIYEKQNNFEFLTKKVVLSFVPKYVIKNYIESEKLKTEILQTIKQGKFVRPLYYSKDTSIKRFFYLLLKDWKYIQKYKNIKW